MGHLFFMLTRRILLLTASLAISFITIFFILFFTPYKITQETIDVLTKINPFYLSLAIGMHLAAWIFWGFRLRILSNFVALSGDREVETNDLSLVRSMKIILSGLFAACITPSQFGGEPVRIYLLKKNGFSVGDGTAVVFGERALDMVVITVGAAISFLLFRVVLPHHSIIYTIFTVIGICLSAGVAVMTYGLMKPEKAKKAVESLLKIKRLEKIMSKLYQELENFLRAMNRFRYKGKTTLGLALLFTVAFWLLTFMIPSFLLLGFGANPIWIYSIAAQFILIIIMAVPITPGSSGVAEISATYLYHTLVGTPLLGIFALMWRLSTYYMDLIVGGITSVKILGEIT